jgi:SAM-dependent methyltransferase
MASLFQNDRQARYYAAARPSYPKALFQKIFDAVKCPKNDKNDDYAIWRAADFGCGTGQATVALADFFPSVIGIDPSPSQIEQAESHENVKYVVGTDSDPRLLEPQSLACITAAQAAHWFDLPKFYDVVNSALRPGGVLALIVYGNVKFPKDAVLERMIAVDLYEEKLAAYWDPRRRLVEYMYRDLDTIDRYYVDFETEVFPKDDDGDDARESNEAISKIETVLTDAELLGYLRSWSGYTKCVEAKAYFEENSESDPLYDIVQYLKTRPVQVKIRTVWPLKLLLSTKQGRLEQCLN